MAADIYLAFGADTGQMEAGLAAAQAAVRATAAEMRTLASEMVKTGAATDSELGNRLAELGSKLADAKEHVTGFKEELKGTEGEGFIGGMVEKVKGFLAPLNEAKMGLAELTEVIAAAFAVEKIVEFIKQMGELGEATMRSSRILGLTPQQVGELNYALEASGVKLEDVQRALARWQVGLAQAQKGTGPVAEGLQALGLSASELVKLPLQEQLEKVADALAKFPDSPTKTAAVQALGRGFIEMLPALDAGGERLRDLFAEFDAINPKLNETAPLLTQMKENATALAEAWTSLTTAAFEPFIPVVNGTLQVMQDLFQAITDSINQSGVWKTALDEIALALRIVVTAVAGLIIGFQELWTIATNGLAAIRDELLGLTNQLGSFFNDLLHGDMTFSTFRAAGHETTEAVKGDFKAMGDDLITEMKRFAEEYRKTWEGFGDTAEEAAARAKAAVHGATTETGVGGGTAKVPAIDTSPWGAATRAVEALTRSLEEVQGQLEGKKGLSAGPLSEADRDRVIRTIYGEADKGNVESEQAVADVIRNRLLSPTHAYGTDIGEVTKPSQFSAWGDARTLPGMQGLSKDSDMYKQIGEQVDKVFSGAVSDITKGASNYYAPSGMAGGRAPSWAAKTEAENLQVIGTQRFSGRVSGLPAEPTGEAPTGAEREKLLETQRSLNVELDKAKQKLLDLKTEEAGGTETAKTKLAIDEADAKQKGDAVENAKKLQAAAEADLAAAKENGATKERLLKLETEVAKAKEAVNAATLKQTEAEGKLSAEKAKSAGDTEKEKAAELAVVDAKIKAAGADKAALAAAETEKLAIEQKYADQSKSLAMQKASEEIAAVRTAAQNKIKDIDLEFRAKQISESQKVAMTKAALAEEIAAEKSIYEQELALDNLRPAERQKILAELAAAETKYAQQVKETQIKAAEDSSKAWTAMADKVAGILNSQVSGVISGTTTVKQAFSNMAKSIIEDVTKYAIKWAVEHAFAATQVMAQNTAVTTSSIAGQTAVDAAKTASSGAGIAMQAADAVKSIAIDGAKTFGGVFGFLAPLLGPFAAGPAAGAQATVLAAGAAFDTGAWNLPRDMIAAVHAGEMVIPSRGGVADEFRSFLSGGGFDRMGRGDVSQAGSSTKSVSVNPAVHFNVSAIDGQSAASFFQNNHKHIMTAVDRAVRHGSALGLRTFTR